MKEVVYCKDCKFSSYWRSGKIAEIYGRGLECNKNIIPAPRDGDYCSIGEKKIKKESD